GRPTAALPRREVSWAPPWDVRGSPGGGVERGLAGSTVASPTGRATAGSAPPERAVRRPAVAADKGGPAPTAADTGEPMSARGPRPFPNSDPHAAPTGRTAGLAPPLRAVRRLTVAADRRGTVPFTADAGAHQAAGAGTGEPAPFTPDTGTPRAVAVDTVESAPRVRSRARAVDMVAGAARLRTGR
ncbi:hypothetical protein KDA82_38315, partial [Streptomyces daliensis]|nr:hypothetical protein [Streptomyces daliensis]